MEGSFNHESFEDAVRKTHPGASYIRDGIISPEFWQKSKVKVLFILKESNDCYEPNLAELINRAITQNPKSKLWHRPTFHNIGRWAYGLQNLTSTAPAFELAHHHRKSALLSCAFINLKKITGGRRATEEVQKFTEAHQAFLREQIRSISPDIVVMGGTYNIIKAFVIPELQKVSPRVHMHEGTPFINAFHPACTVARPDLYDQVLNSILQYTEQSAAPL
ncbi:hypothetical protein QVM41_26285 [Pseudomonas shirazica]|uniref:hypothetical protein n=1 Tax=Pseudomonas shirazica TaxID=1940636 RepID=UPI003524C954